MAAVYVTQRPSPVFPSSPRLRPRPRPTALRDRASPSPIKLSSPRSFPSQTKKLRKLDCNNRYCIWSSLHPPTCHPCLCEKVCSLVHSSSPSPFPSVPRLTSALAQFLGPDAKETVTLRSEQYCSECHYWYRGAGRRR